MSLLNIMRDWLETGSDPKQPILQHIQASFYLAACVKYFAMDHMLFELEVYKFGAAVIIFLITGIPLIRIMTRYRTIQSDMRFDRFCKLVSQLTEGFPVLRQIAIVFELSQYREYYAIAHRLLLQLKLMSPEMNKALLDEIERTIEYIEHQF